MKYPNASRPVVLLQPHHGLRCFLQSLIQESDGLHLAAHAADSLTARQTLAGIDNPIIVADPWLPPCSVFDLCKKPVGSLENPSIWQQEYIQRIR